MSNEDTKDKLRDALEDVRDSIAIDDWLKIIAETCIEHMKYVEMMERESPEGLTVDDYGLLELEKGFLVMYAERTQGGVPQNDETKH